MWVRDDIYIPETEIEMKAVGAQGPGGQNVNKVATAIQLFFDINSSSLPEKHKEKLLCLSDRRITRDGLVVIKASNYRTQKKNKEDALRRLREFIREATAETKPRKPTRPSGTVKEERLQEKKRTSRIKELRKPVDPDE